MFFSFFFFFVSLPYLHILQDVREDLRASMANDVVTIKNEGFKVDEWPNHRLIISTTDEERISEPSSLDFQRKITLSKHEKQDASSTSVLRNGETYKRLFGMQILYSYSSRYYYFVNMIMY